MWCKQKYITVATLLLWSCSLFAQHIKVFAPAPVLPLPSNAQVKWHEMELNAFIHFTTNTFTGLEWGYGDEKETVFNPRALNVNQWANTLKQSGFKTIILTCKHHDGFCLWPGKYTEHSVKNSPYKNARPNGPSGRGKGDIVKEVSDACKKYGLKFGVYLSPWDRNRADYGKPSYITYYRNQLKELFTRYGPITEMWFDGANGGDGYYGGAKEKRQINGATYYDWPGTIKMVQAMQPNVIFFSDAGPGVRWVGNEKGIAGTTNWNTINIDTLYAGKAGIEELLNTGAEDGNKWVPAEVDVSIRPGWFYHEQEDSLVKSPQQLFDIYLSSVGRGSTLLLNIPPDKRGLFHENDVKSLLGFKAIIEKEFAKNLALKANITADSYRGNKNIFSPKNLVDGDKETYWATDDSIHAGSFEISLPVASVVKYIVLQEYIKLGQRIKKFSADVWKDGAWYKVSEGTTIGYKKILKIEPVLTKKIRVNIIQSKACPVISNAAIY